MSENNITKLRADLDQKAADEASEARENFETAELTDDEKERIEKMRTERAVVVEDTDVNGTTKEVPLSQFAASLDSRVAGIVGGDHASVVKMINRGDIKQDIEAVKKQARDMALKAFHELSVSKHDGDGGGMTDDDYLKINDEAIRALMKHFNVDKIDSDNVVRKLAKRSLKDICEILPAEFVSLYVTDAELFANSYKAKERLLSTIAYLCVTGPELDYLNDYIDDENKMMVVGQRLLACQTDIAEALKDKRNWAELLASVQEISPLDTSFWSKHITEPNKVHNEFAQRAVLYKKYSEAYTKILDDYPVVSLAEYLDKPDEMPAKAKEAALNEKARAQILAEIEECDKKAEIYQSITNLELLHKLWGILVERLKANKRTNFAFLDKEALSAVERIRRSKQNVSFPGYQGNERNAAQIYSNYLDAYINMLANYNETLTGVLRKENNPETEITPIKLEGYGDLKVFTMFSMLLCILMGRVMKALGSHDVDRFDAITADAYFQLFCRMGLDVYVMNDVWVMMRDFVKYCLDNYPAESGKCRGGKKR